jgi:hypothetical protein
MGGSKLDINETDVTWHVLDRLLSDIVSTGPGVIEVFPPLESHYARERGSHTMPITGIVTLVPQR